MDKYKIALIYGDDFINKGKEDGEIDYCGEIDSDSLHVVRLLNYAKDINIIVYSSRFSIMDLFTILWEKKNILGRCFIARKEYFYWLYIINSIIDIFN